eukprot:13189763-Alexandrium_andersonii.AAC.1
MPALQAPAIARSGPSTALACSVAACAPGPVRGHHGLADVRAQRVRRPHQQSGLVGGPPTERLATTPTPRRG